jgi:hypothetical protein
MNAMATSSLLAQVVAQQLPIVGSRTRTPSRWTRRAVVGGVDVDAAVEVHCSLAVLVGAEGLELAVAADRTSNHGLGITRF